MLVTASIQAHMVNLLFKQCLWTLTAAYGHLLQLMTLSAANQTSGSLQRPLGCGLAITTVGHVLKSFLVEEIFV